jgi:hypothetical protein
MLIEDIFHDSPETFLPFEDSLLRYNIRNNFGIQASGEKVMRKISNVI